MNGPIKNILNEIDRYWAIDTITNVNFHVFLHLLFFGVMCCQESFWESLDLFKLLNIGENCIFFVLLNTFLQSFSSKKNFLFQNICSWKTVIRKRILKVKKSKNSHDFFFKVKFIRTKNKFSLFGSHNFQSANFFQTKVFKKNFQGKVHQLWESWKNWFICEK